MQLPQLAVVQSLVSLHYPVVLSFPQTPLPSYGHTGTLVVKDVSPGCGISREHQYSQRTMEEVVNRRLRKRRKRRPDGKTHRAKTKALIDHLLLKQIGKKTSPHLSN